MSSSKDSLAPSERKVASSELPAIHNSVMSPAIRYRRTTRGPWESVMVMKAKCQVITRHDGRTYSHVVIDTYYGISSMTTKHIPMAQTGCGINSGPVRTANDAVV